jgi:hypothetical protein
VTTAAAPTAQGRSTDSATMELESWAESRGAEGMASVVLATTDEVDSVAGEVVEPDEHEVANAIDAVHTMKRMRRRVIHVGRFRSASGSVQRRPILTRCPARQNCQ